ncbi:MAG TPA: hypothetical protein VK892_03530 [Pyrinomonadaceae bacterium]|nr:hypothetical protein [Pyrinomonadaceae bacterium]
MGPEYIDLIKTLAPVVTVIIGAWLGSRFTRGNTFQTLSLQNEQKMKEIASERKHKEKENLRSWFEDYAINRCIDPLSAEILFIQNLFVQVASKKRTRVELKIEIPPIPFDACVRLFNLTGATGFPYLLHMARQALTYDIDEKECQKYTQFLNGILIGLLKLKQILLDIEIKQKSDLYEICNNPLVRQGGEFLDNSISNMFELDKSAIGGDMSDMLRRMAQKAADSSDTQIQKKE